MNKIYLWGIVITVAMLGFTYMSVGAATGAYGWAFWSLILFNILIPQLLWVRKFRRSFF